MKLLQSLVKSEVCLAYLQVPIAEGASQTLHGFAKSMYADFVHGQDGFGNTNQPSVKVTIQLAFA